MNSTKPPHVPKNFLNVIKILLLQSQIFGLITFNCNEKKFQRSKTRTLYSVSLIITYASLIVYSIYKIAIIDEPLSIYKTTDTLLLLVNGCYVCTMWACAIMNQDNLIAFLVKITDFDNQMPSHTIANIREHTRKRILTGMLIRYPVLILLITFLLIAALMNLKNHELVADAMGYILMVINSVACHQITELVLMLKARFHILNQQLKTIVVYFKNNVRTVYKSPKNQFLALSKVCALHHHLTKMVKLFNEVFGVVLLLMFGASFVAIVLAFFYCSGELQSTKIRWINLFWALFSCVSFVLDTIYVCDVCYETIEEVSSMWLVFLIHVGIS